MEFIDFFAGIGGFRHGMELAGHKCVGFCEWDKFAVASYTSMHLITERQREKLSKLTMKKRQKEILKEEYRNGEWYADDIRSVVAGSLPNADCWCFGAPCQDFSVAGKRKGLDGDRSVLVQEIFRLLEEQKEKDRPEWLIYENVKGMLSSNRGLDYLSILSEMDRLGYDIEWQNINSAWFVPQNRERIYTIGHLRTRGTRKIFPVEGTNGENYIQQLGNYLPTKNRDNPNQGRIYSADGISPCLNKMDGGSREPSVAIPIQKDILLPGNNFNQRKTVHPPDGIFRTLISNGHSGNEPKVAIPVLTPDRAKKRQNGRRFKENGEPMFTLTGQDRHGVGVSVYDMYNHSLRNDGICGTLTSNGNTSTTHCGSFGVIIPVKENSKQGYSIAHEGDAIDLKSYCSSTRKGTVKRQIAGALDHDCNQGIFVQVSNKLTVYAIWYEEYQCYIAIRKLTPKECFRLQGWEDIYFERAAFVNSDSQLYKQAGNGVTVNVVYAIGEKL